MTVNFNTIKNIRLHTCTCLQNYSITYQGGTLIKPNRFCVLIKKVCDRFITEQMEPVDKMRDIE